MDYRVDREQILQITKKMITSGLVIETWGNVSARIAGKDQMLITPSGRDYLSMKPEDLIIVNFAGEKISGPFNPSSEKWLHIKIYLHNPQIKALVHVHSIFSAAFAVSHATIPVILEEIAQVVGHPVETVPYKRCGSIELAEAAAECFHNKRAVLLANHGLIAGAQDAEAALRVCQVIERTAQAAVYSHILGRAPISLPADDVTDLCRRFVAYDAQKQLISAQEEI